jgi:hypothetical protein
MSELSMERRARVTIEILAKYPSEFEPHEHEFAADAERILDAGTDEEVDHLLVSASLWSRVERLWSHERGMLGDV